MWAVKEDPKERVCSRNESRRETDAITVVVWTIMPKSAVSPLNPRSATTARAPPTWWRTVRTKRPRPLREDTAQIHLPPAQARHQALTVQKQAKELPTQLRTAPPPAPANPPAPPKTPRQKLPHHREKRGKNEGERVSCGTTLKSLRPPCLIQVPNVSILLHPPYLSLISTAQTDISGALQPHANEETLAAVFIHYQLNCEQD